MGAMCDVRCAMIDDGCRCLTTVSTIPIVRSSCYDFHVTFVRRPRPTKILSTVCTVSTVRYSQYIHPIETCVSSSVQPPSSCVWIRDFRSTRIRMDDLTHFPIALPSLSLWGTYFEQSSSSDQDKRAGQVSDDD